jgi:hypothetical protein
VLSRWVAPRSPVRAGFVPQGSRTGIGGHQPSLPFRGTAGHRACGSVAGMMHVGDSDCGHEGPGWLRRAADGQQPVFVTTGEPASKSWRIMSVDSAPTATDLVFLMHPSRSSTPRSSLEKGPCRSRTEVVAWGWIRAESVPQRSSRAPAVTNGRRRFRGIAGRWPCSSCSRDDAGGRFGLWSDGQEGSRHPGRASGHR